MLHFFARLSFIIGVLIGIFFAVLLKSPAKQTNFKVKKYVLHNLQYETWFKQRKLEKKSLLFDNIRYDVNKTYNLESDYLFKEINVLCLILIRNNKNVKAAKDTWTKGCNQIQLIHLEEKINKKLPVKRKKENSSWVLLCTQLKLLSENEFKWILIVYDYTFVIMENLRYFVASINENHTHYLGHTLKFWNTLYNMGQAGYVLSKGSLKKLQQKLHKRNFCLSDLTYYNQEDYYLGKHLSSLNITPTDTRDWQGLSTFHPYNWYHLFSPGENYYKFSIYPNKCCSPYSITFQAIEGDKMYTYYYLLYTLQIFTDGNMGNRLPPPTNENIVWKRFLNERNITGNVSHEQYYKLWEDLVDDPTSFAQKMKLDYD